MRIASMLRTSRVKGMPSTMMSPLWCSSRRLMVRINVDLPEPEGPMITTTSCRLTDRLTFLRAWNSPYHLLTSRQTMISSCNACPAIAESFMICEYVAALPLAHAQLGFEVAAGGTHAKAKDKEDQGHK